MASLGTYSGPAAASVKPSLEGVQLWVKVQNARGGLNGHPVNLIVYDDGGDPARFRAQLQEAVERRGILGVLQMSAPLTGQAGVDYVNSKRIPVIGLGGGEAYGYSSPYLFPQSPVGETLYRTFAPSMARQLAPQGKTRLGMLYCAEAQGCADAARVVGEDAQPAGLKLVYEAKVSLAQPDFTAECLAARNAGAQILFLFSDSNSTGRIAGSCTRQGFRPQFVVAHAIALDRHARDPNLDGMLSSSAVFPWFQTGTPPTDEFRAAVKAYGRGSTVGVSMALGWVTGKLLEKVGAEMPEPPTTAALLSGLWKIKEDDLGGITAPLTFAQDQAAIPRSCWFDIAIGQGEWRSVDGFQLHCRQLRLSSQL